MAQGQRRQILIALGALCAAPHLGIAQPAKRPPVVGVLGPEAPSTFWPEGFTALLRKSGLEPGRDFVLDVRWSGGDVARLPKFAEELVASGVAIVVALANYSIDAARRATQTIPILMLFGLHPVEMGYIKSFAKPSGNVTGMSWSPPEIPGKQLELLRDIVPNLKRLAVLVNSEHPGMRFATHYSLRAAAAYGITRKTISVTRPGDFSQALEQIAASRPDALFVVATDEIARRQSEVIAFAREHRLISLGTSSTWAASGGVLQYGPDITEHLERGASYVARLLRGAKVADLPVEQPRTYRLVVNVKAAQVIGYKIPASLLARADRVIE